VSLRTAMKIVILSEGSSRLRSYGSASARAQAQPL